MRLFPTLAAATLAALTSPSLSAQLVISEVNFAKGDQWIELHNQTTGVVDLSSYSMYHATKTKFKVGDYWWPFPAKTKIGKGGFLRIKWGALIPTSPVANEVSTGTSSLHFLFGHGFEAFDRTQGALAICTTKLNNQVNAASVFLDWVQWGDKGFKREAIAVNNKPKSLWVKDAFVPTINSGSSLMLVTSADSNPSPITAFYSDATPTPNALNTDGMALASEGTPCGSYPTPVGMVADPHPFHGNAGYTLRLKNTLGEAYGESAYFTLDFSANTVKFLGCDLLTNGPQYLFLVMRTSSTEANNKVTLPLVPNLARGLTVWMQAYVGSTNVFNGYSLTNRIKMSISK